MVLLLVLISKYKKSDRTDNKCYLLKFYFIFLGLVFGTLKILISYEFSYYSLLNFYVILKY